MQPCPILPGPFETDPCHLRLTCCTRSTPISRRQHPPNPILAHLDMADRITLPLLATKLMTAMTTNRVNCCVPAMSSRQQDEKCSRYFRNVNTDGNRW